MQIDLLLQTILTLDLVVALAGRVQRYVNPHILVHTRTPGILRSDAPIRLTTFAIQYSPRTNTFSKYSVYENLSITATLLSKGRDSQQCIRVGGVVN